MGRFQCGEGNRQHNTDRTCSRPAFSYVSRLADRDSVSLYARMTAVILGMPLAGSLHCMGARTTWDLATCTMSRSVTLHRTATLAPASNRRWPCQHVRTCDHGLIRYSDTGTIAGRGGQLSLLSLQYFTSWAFQLMRSPLHVTVQKWLSTSCCPDTNAAQYDNHFQPVPRCQPQTGTTDRHTYRSAKVLSRAPGQHGRGDTQWTLLSALCVFVEALLDAILLLTLPRHNDKTTQPRTPSILRCRLQQTSP